MGQKERLNPFLEMRPVRNQSAGLQLFLRVNP